MTLFSPNLSALVGSEVAARLLSAAGGLERLSSMSVPGLLLLGRQARNLVAHKAILAARADCGGANAGGGIGMRFAMEVSVVIERWEKSRKSFSLEDLIGSMEEVGVNNNDNIGLRNSHIGMLSVVRDDEKFKLKNERPRRVSRAMEESLALALEGIEIADEEEEEKDLGGGSYKTLLDMDGL